MRYKRFAFVAPPTGEVQGVLFFSDMFNKHFVNICVKFCVNSIKNKLFMANFVLPYILAKVNQWLNYLHLL